MGGIVSRPGKAAAQWARKRWSTMLIFVGASLATGLLLGVWLSQARPNSAHGPTSAVIQLASGSASVKGDTVHSALDPLIPGHMAFKIPTTMQVDQTDTVNVRIAKDSLRADLTTGLEGAGVPRDVAVQVAPIMTVELHGHGFQIEPLFSVSQRSTADTQFADWEWDVTPTSSGTLKLEVVVAAQVGPDPPRYFTGQRQSVSILVSPMKAVLKFAGSNWQWLFGLVPFGAVGAWLRQRRHTP